MPSRDTVNENAHAWITVALPTLLVCSDIVGILSGSDEPSLRRTRLYQSLHAFYAIHTPEQRWTRRVPATVVLLRIVKFSQALIEIVGMDEKRNPQSAFSVHVLLFLDCSFIPSQGSVSGHPLSASVSFLCSS